MQSKKVSSSPPLHRDKLNTTHGGRTRQLLATVKPLRPACERCAGTYTASKEVVSVYYKMLSNVKSQFLDDTIKHIGHEDIWLRALRNLGVPDRKSLPYS